jgi:hypothetical protein
LVPDAPDSENEDQFFGAFFEKTTNLYKHGSLAFSFKPTDNYLFRGKIGQKLASGLILTKFAGVSGLVIFAAMNNLAKSMDSDSIRIEANREVGT